MSLLTVVFELTLIVTTMMVTASLVIVGPRRLLATLQDIRWRLEMCAIPVVVLAVVLALRWSLVDVTMRLERRVVGINITPALFELEESIAPVAVLQSFQTPELTSVFVFIYIYGYAFLLLFPFVAYVALEEMDDLSTLIVAFSANYAIGLLFYVLFIAYGPRNVDPTLFQGLLYDAFPQSRSLTNQVNQNTNVFPSLHTSLSMTVFVLAWHTRDKYPVWLPVSGVLAVGVVISTMYLGIHWFTDAVAGTLLALLSVYLARTYDIHDIVERARARATEFVTGLRRPDRE